MRAEARTAAGTLLRRPDGGANGRLPFLATPNWPRLEPRQGRSAGRPS